MFITPDEIKTHLYDYQVEQITDNDSTIVTAAIDTAVAEVRSYLANRYDCDAIFSTSRTVQTVPVEPADEEQPAEEEPIEEPAEEPTEEPTEEEPTEEPTEEEQPAEPQVQTVVTDNRPPLVVDLVKTCAAWHLLLLCNVDAIYERYEKAYERAIAYLKQVAEGLLTPDLPYRDTGDGSPAGTLQLGSRPKFTHSF